MLAWMDGWTDGWMDESKHNGREEEKISFL